MNSLVPVVELALPDLSERWVKYLDVEKTSVLAYNKAIKRFVSYTSSRGINKPTREDVLAYREELVKTGHKPSTVQLYIQAVKLFFRWTELEGIYPDIAQHVKGAKLDQAHKKDFLSSQQAGVLISEIDTSTLTGKRDQAIISLMLTSGLRTIEVQRAVVEDLQDYGKFKVLYIQGKGHQEKTDYVKVVDEVSESIEAYLEARKKTEGPLKDNTPLFGSVSNRNRGGKMTTQSISRLVKNHLEESGLKTSRVTAHSLRHTAATLNLLNGGTLEETKQMLRHSSINTTMIYVHALEREQNNSEENIARAIFSNNKEEK